MAPSDGSIRPADSLTRRGATMANLEKRRRRQHGRRADHTFLALPHFILRSDEFGRLSPKAVKLLVELAGLYKGDNNGDLSAAYSVLKERGWRSAGTLADAIRELRESRFLLTTRHGGKHRCSLYAITWWPIDECKGKLEVPSSRQASHAWKNENGSRISDQSSRISDQFDEIGGRPCLD